jgi:3-hydroxybutyryl-CoA dehydrogenase
MERIAVVGAGLMGHGIAQVFASHGHPVAIYDVIPEALARVPERVRANLRALGETESYADKITLHNTMAAAVADADLVVEAVLEKLPLKQEIFRKLAQRTHPNCILASNTSVIPITAIAANVADAGRILGTHWWNPPYLVPLVEVIQAERTELKYVERCLALLQLVGKTPVHVKRDVPGFVGNRLQHALWREAISIVAAGICDARTVDLVVKNSFGLRLPVLGPLENADLAGLDLTLDIHSVILRDLDASPDPSPLLRHYVDEQCLGMKSGRGFYEWTAESAQQLRDRLTQHLGAATRRSAAAEGKNS